MKQSRFTDEQIIGCLKQADAVMSVKELCRPEALAMPYMSDIPAFAPWGLQMLPSLESLKPRSASSRNSWLEPF
jgi:hypothetical protein